MRQRNGPGCVPATRMTAGADHPGVEAEEPCEIYVVVAVHPPQPITTRMPVSSQPPPTM
jgi:hypothetical protein